MRSIHLFILIAAAAVAHAENWPQWRGIRLDGTSRDTGFPLACDEESLTWKVELEGEGHASPIVWQDRLFVVASDADKEERLLLCLDRATGKNCGAVWCLRPNWRASTN